MKINPIHGLSVALVTVLAGCTSPKEAFLDANRQRPSEQCLPFDGTIGQENRQQMAEQMPAVTNHDEIFGDHFPMQYVVKKGDTLWDISKKFLAKPWYWKQIWHDNPQIKNPHLIYPGDVLSVVAIDGQKYVSITKEGQARKGKVSARGGSDLPVVKYSPHVREQSLADGPISIAHATIRPHLMKTKIYAPEAIKDLPFIYGDAGDYLTLSMQHEIYAKGLTQLEGQYFDIYRVAQPIFDLEKYNQPSPYAYDPDRKPIGYQMDYIGKAGLVKHDLANDLSVLNPIEVVRDMREGDVIVPVDARDEIMQYFPQLPSAYCNRGYIVKKTNNSTLAIKEFDTIITSFGADNNARPGDVWKIARSGPTRVINGQVLQTPDKDIGYLMIYRVYNDVSLAFVLDSSQEIYETDYLVRP